MATMSPELRQAVEQAGDDPVELTDPETNTAYVVLRADLYRELRDILDEERRRSAMGKKAFRNAAAQLDGP